MLLNSCALLLILSTCCNAEQVYIDTVTLFLAALAHAIGEVTTMLAKVQKTQFSANQPGARSRWIVMMWKKIGCKDLWDAARSTAGRKTAITQQGRRRTLLVRTRHPPPLQNKATL